jgi:hypothetical protein
MGQKSGSVKEPAKQVVKGLCQVYVLGTSDGCIAGRDYRGIETSSPARFLPMVV